MYSREQYISAFFFFAISRTISVQDGTVNKLDLDVTDLQLVIVERLPTPHRAFAATSASDQEHGPDSGTRRAGEQRKLGHRCI